MLILNSLLLFIVGYFTGSVPFGYLLGKTKKIDIRKLGSGNIGATNASRQLGLIYGILVGILDFLKSYLFVFLIFSSNYLPLTLKIIISIAPIIGHIFSIWLKFKGGKGVTCTYALFIAIFGWKFFAIWVIIWLVLLLTTRLMSLTNLLISLSFPIFFWIKFHSLVGISVGVGLTLVIWFTHRQNIKRLLAGTENKI
jgi:glycerol-3-phosphate acyltransferase PlsY